MTGLPREDLAILSSLSLTRGVNSSLTVAIDLAITVLFC